MNISEFEKPASEKLAKIKGFQNIYVASGNVENLKEIILQNISKK